MTREHWKSRVGFLLAAIGCAVGLGNIWRFPYVAYKSGGGAFFVPYLIAVFLVGIPLMILEQGVGQMEQGGAPLTFRKIRKNWEWIGWWAVVFCAFGIACYYNVVLSWCVNYLVYSFDLRWGSDPASFFNNSFLRVSSGPFDFGVIRLPILGGVALMWGLTWLVLRRGIAKGIEVITKIFMPILFLLIVILVIWSLTLPGASQGIRAYLTPDFSKILQTQIWRDAFGQVFFSMSLGYGMMIAYASYLPKETNINNNAVIVALTNSGFEVFAGFAVFSTLGFMALQLGKPVDQVVVGGPGLSFVTYPQAINQLPFGKNFFGVLFFGTLVIAGFTSIISIMECFITAVLDKFSWPRRRVVNVSCGISFLAGILFTTHAGIYWLDLVDHFINQFGVLVVAFLETILVTRIFGTRKFLEFVNSESTTQIGPVWKFGLCIFTPIILLVLLIFGAWEDFQRPYENYSWDAVIFIGLGWLLATLLAGIFFTRARWEADSLPLFH